jgi:hypothetical protein
MRLPVGAVIPPISMELVDNWQRGELARRRIWVLFHFCNGRRAAMKKVLLACVGAFCLLTASAFADEGLPSTSVLDDMGLSGMQILTDSDTLAVRGKGWLPHLTLNNHVGAKKPWVAAGGISIAGFKYEKDYGSLDGTTSTSKDGIAGSINFYLGEGKYKAGGVNASYASKTTKDVTKTAVDGWVKIKSHITTKTISAGGYSSGHAF